MLTIFWSMKSLVYERQSYFCLRFENRRKILNLLYDSQIENRLQKT